MTYSDAYAMARRKAQYGHRSWLVWSNKQGETFAAVMNADSLKKAMLATGTQGWFLIVGPKRGEDDICRWWMANNIRRQFLKGWRNV